MSSFSTLIAHLQKKSVTSHHGTTKQDFKHRSGRLALGVDWSSFSPPTEPPTLWSTTQFNAKKNYTTENITNQPNIGSNQKAAMVNESCEAKMLCRDFMNKTINNAIVEMANACGIKFRPKFSDPRLCANKSEVCRALLSSYEVDERAALVHFMTSYVKDYLHGDVHGISHQFACEDAFLEYHNLTFGDNGRDTLDPKFKPCTSNMYNEVFNRIKHHMIRACFPPGFTVSVVPNDSIKADGKKFKRDKHVFFVHASEPNPDVPGRKKTVVMPFDLRRFTNFVHWKRMTADRMLEVAKENSNTKKSSKTIANTGIDSDDLFRAVDDDLVLKDIFNSPMQQQKGPGLSEKLPSVGEVSTDDDTETCSESSFGFDSTRKMSRGTESDTDESEFIPTADIVPTERQSEDEDVVDVSGAQSLKDVLLPNGKIRKESQHLQSLITKAVPLTAPKKKSSATVAKKLEDIRPTQQPADKEKKKRKKDDSKDDSKKKRKKEDSRNKCKKDNSKNKSKKDTVVPAKKVTDKRKQSDSSVAHVEAVLEVVEEVDPKTYVCQQHKQCFTDLLQMSDYDVRHYSKEGGYFSGRKCAGGCRGGIKDMKSVFYCQPGFNAGTMKDDENPSCKTCFFALCMECHSKSDSESTGSRSRRSRRSR